MKVIYTSEEIVELNSLKEEVISHFDEYDMIMAQGYVTDDMANNPLVVRAEVREADFLIEYDPEKMIAAFILYKKVVKKAAPTLKKLIKALVPILELFDDGLVADLKELYTYIEDQVPEVLED